MEFISDLGKIFVPVSIFFVWVVRYENIVKEFKQYSLPDWIRDLVGILKLSFALMIATGDGYLLKVGTGGIAALMLAALMMHVKIKNPPQKMLPALTLLILSLVIFMGT